MNRVGALPLVFLLGSLTAIAQTSGTAQTTPNSPANQAQNRSTAQAILRMPLLHKQNYCPTGILVKQVGIARLLYIKDSPPPEGPAVGLRITLGNSRAVGIVWERITVRGYTTGGVVTAAATTGGVQFIGTGLGFRTGGLAPATRSATQSSQTFRLALRVNPGEEASTDLWVKGLVSVS
jgi:hypothetical protein